MRWVFRAWCSRASFRRGKSLKSPPQAPSSWRFCARRAVHVCFRPVLFQRGPPEAAAATAACAPSPAVSPLPQTAARGGFEPQGFVSDAAPAGAESPGRDLGQNRGGDEAARICGGRRFRLPSRGRRRGAARRSGGQARRGIFPFGLYRRLLHRQKEAGACSGTAAGRTSSPPRGGALPACDVSGRVGEDSG